MRILLFLLFINFHAFSFNNNIDQKIYLVSTPRSGLHWLTYSITTMSGHKALRIHDAEKFGHLLTPAAFNEKLNPIYTYHLFPDLDIKKNDKLIVLTRNCLDSLLRQYGNYNQVVSILEELLDKKNRYPSFHFPLYTNKKFKEECGSHYYKGEFIYEQLSLYENWNPEERLLIYYEDIIANPSEVFIQIMTFLEENWAINDYLQTIDNHKEFIREYYLAQEYGSINSDSKELHPYSQNLNPAQIKKINYLLGKLDKNLFEKYKKNEF